MSHSVEFLGHYATLDEYFRSQLEELVSPAGGWILDCLDAEKILERFEAGVYRYFVTEGCVFRVMV
jgi:hypothetical protein